MYQTNYVKAANTDEAVDHMSSGGQLLAGGMTLIPTMKQRLASPETLIDLAETPNELRQRASRLVEVLNF